MSESGVKITASYFPLAILSHAAECPSRVQFSENAFAFKRYQGFLNLHENNSALPRWNTVYVFNGKFEGKLFFQVRLEGRLPCSKILLNFYRNKKPERNHSNTIIKLQKTSDFTQESPITKISRIFEPYVVCSMRSKKPHRSMINYLQLNLSRRKCSSRETAST